MIKRNLFISFNFINKLSLIFSQILSAVLGIILGKILALNIDPELFGKYNLEFGIASFLISFFIQPFLQYFKKYFKNIFFSTGFYHFLIIILLISIFSTIITSIIFYLFDFLESFFFTLILFLFFFLFTLENIVNGYLNINSSFKKLSVSILLKSSSTLFVCVALIYFYDIKFNNSSFIWGINLIGFIISVAFLMNPILRIKTEFTSQGKVNDLSESYSRFAFPLFILAIWSWVNNYVDRFFLDFFFTKELVGLYSVNYGLASKVFLLFIPIALSLITPISYSNISINQKFKKIKKYIYFYLFISIILLGIIFKHKNLIGELFLSKMYTDGFFVIPIISLSFFFLTFSYFFETIFYSEGRTKYILYTSIFSSLINVFFLFLLVPLYDIAGASYATLISFFCYFMITVFFFLRLKKNNMVGIN